MNAITITREYGAGGYEVARRLAEALGWELLDRELLRRAAAVEHLPDAELERLDEKAISLADRLRLHPPHQHYIHGLTEAARSAAARGNVVLVGRGTGQLLVDAVNVFHLRLAAPRQWRAARMARLEGWTMEAALARCTQEDHIRDRFTRYFFGEGALQPARYHAIFNTERVPLEDVVASVVGVIRNSCATAVSAVPGQPNTADTAVAHTGAPAPQSLPTTADTAVAHTGAPAPQSLPTTADTAVAHTGGRVLTLARELGAGERSFAAALGSRLGLHVYDRELLEQEAVRLGIGAEEVERVDEQPAGFFQRFVPNSLHQRYFKTLGKLMSELAAHGGVLIVGRGGTRFLRDHPSAFHVRLVAPMDVRVRRVMEHRWVREAPARHLIADSDSARRRFYQDFFGPDWADPLEYHLTVNGGLLGPAEVDLVALAAQRRWQSREKG